MLPVVVIAVVLTKINVDQVLAAVATSDWRWSLVAFGLGLVTFLGAALTFRAFSPVRVPLGRLVLVQAAGAFLAVAAPAALGAGALNLRVMVRRGVSASLAVASVALVQVSQFVVTLTLLLVLSLVSGSDAAAALVPSGGTLEIVAAVVLLAAAALLVTPLRRWVLARVMPVLRQTWPRLLDVLAEPGRIVLAVIGDALLTLGWVLAFGASLSAFGVHLSLVQIAVIYFAGNLAGSAVPTPGGLGGIELALIGLAHRDRGQRSASRPARCSCSAPRPTGCRSRSAGWRCGSCVGSASCSRTRPRTRRGSCDAWGSSAWWEQRGGAVITGVT